MSAIEEYKFTKRLKELESIKGSGTEMISLYINPSRKIHDVRSFLSAEINESSSIKSKQTRNNVTSAIESCIQTLKNIQDSDIKPNGLALFVGNGCLPGKKEKIHKFCQKSA